jgi:hypothetical protein
VQERLKISNKAVETLHARRIMDETSMVLFRENDEGC